MDVMDAVGSNIVVNTRCGEVMRILPRMNEVQELSVILKINRGYYTAAQRYEFYFRVVKTIFYEQAQRVSKILFFFLRK